MTRTQIESEVRRTALAPWLTFLALALFAATLVGVIGADGKGSTVVGLVMGGVFWVFGLRQTWQLRRASKALLEHVPQT